MNFLLIRICLEPHKCPSAVVADVRRGVAGWKVPGGNSFLEAHTSSTLALESQIDFFENEDAWYGAGHARYGANHAGLRADNAGVVLNDRWQSGLNWCFSPYDAWWLILVIQGSNLEVQVIDSEVLARVIARVWGARPLFSLATEAAALDRFDRVHGDGGACVIDTATIQ